MKNIVLIMLMLVPLLPLHAATQSEMERSSRFLQGVQDYNAGAFQAAVDAWMSILEDGSTAAELHYNLGNGYFKLQDYPKALLHYKRAKRLHPWDQNIIANLTLTESRATVFSVDRPSWYEAALAVPASVWRTVLILAGWLTAVFAAVGWVAYAYRGLALRMSFVSGITALLSLAPLWIWQDAVAHPETLLLERTKVRFAPLDDAPVHFELPAGSAVIYEGEDRHWFRVSHQGKEGWIPRSKAVRVIPLNETEEANHP